MTNETLTFTVLPVGVGPPRSVQYAAFLTTDNWDDWFKYSTLYSLIVVDEAGEPHDIGGVKIGQFQMRQGQRRPLIPDQFEKLSDAFFSVGQDDSYYQSLNDLGPTIRDQVLGALRDIANDENIFNLAIAEDVTTVSLLRSVSATTVVSQFRRMASGGARLSQYQFSYTAPRQVASKQPPVELTFEVNPESYPPTNIHVLIGRNGVGKTYVLNLMTRALIEKEGTLRRVGSFSFSSPEQSKNPFISSVGDESQFSRLVSVTFSAFDPFEPLSQEAQHQSGITYSYIGLKRAGASKVIGTPKSPEMLANEFVKSVSVCVKGARFHRWRRALEVLEADPIFKEAGVTALADNDDQTEEAGEFEKRGLALFRKLSSGHKIVLLTMSRLVENVEERTLVLLDEPEAHLHPPLLSAFIRSLSELLVDRNGVAIIATHSPVVLQEVPQTCVWKLRRTGQEANVERPQAETFGENVGVLTREVFGLEVTQAGFHKLLQQAIEDYGTFDAVVARFSGQLGAEALAILRGLVAARGSGKGS